MFFIKNKQFRSKKYPKTSFFMLFEIEKRQFQPKTHQAESISGIRTPYSLRKLFTGLLTAALMAWQQTVISVIVIVASPANKNIHQVKWMR